MSYDLSVLHQFQLAGKTYSHQETLASAGLEGVEAEIPVAKAGELTTRSDDNTGTITMDSSSHGITTGATVDLYWDGGQRRGVTVGTVSGASLPFDLGSGTVLPAEDTVINVAVVQEYTVSIDGDDIESLLATAEFTRCQVVLLEGSTEHLAIHLDANAAYEWLSTGPITNPIAGDPIDTIRITINDTATARKARVAAQLGA